MMNTKTNERLKYKLNMCRLGLYYFQQNKKGEDQGKEKCHAKSMMSNETNERLKRDTQHVPLRQNTEEKVRGKGLKSVWDDANE